MMTDRIGLDDIRIKAQMMRYRILMRKRTIFLATTPNLTQKLNYLYHLIDQRCNQLRSNKRINLMQSCPRAKEQFFSYQKNGSYAILVNFRSRHLSVIILRPFLSKPKICQPDLLIKSNHRSWN